jgi:aerobic carbon-monoxide dehydrogenase medium subunit
VPMLNLRIARPELVVDVNEVAMLDRVETTDGTLTIGALTRLTALERMGGLPRALASALPYVAHPQIRNRTTVGGILAHADPSSELPAVVAALGGTIILTSRAGERLVAAEDFFLGPFTTARRPDELVTQVRVPARGDGVFFEFARRVGDFAIAGVCAVHAGGQIRMCACGAAATPTLLRRAAEAAAGGEPPDRVGALAAEEVDPWDDVQASAAYRRDLVATLVRRAVEALRA